jgi:hypothetical protein
MIRQGRPKNRQTANHDFKQAPLLAFPKHVDPLTAMLAN